MKLLRIKELIHVTGLSRMTIYRLERSGHFPKRRRLGQNSVAWLEEDVALWIASRPAVQRPDTPAASVSALPG
jgi:prophage regulatory protein